MRQMKLPIPANAANRALNKTRLHDGKDVLTPFVTGRSVMVVLNTGAGFADGNNAAPRVQYSDVAEPSDAVGSNDWKNYPEMPAGAVYAANQSYVVGVLDLHAWIRTVGQVTAGGDCEVLLIEGV